MGVKKKTSWEEEKYHFWKWGNKYRLDQNLDTLSILFFFILAADIQGFTWKISQSSDLI